MASEQKFESIPEAREKLAKALPGRRTREGLSVRVKEQRSKRGYSQRELSFDGCSYAYLSRIEAGTRDASLVVLLKLALLLDVSYKYLVGGKGRPRPLTNNEVELILLLIGVTNEDEADAIRTALTDLRAAYGRQKEARIFMDRAAKLLGEK